jgi:uridine kinase
MDERKKTTLKQPAPRLAAIVGGSGAGKTYLARLLQKEFGKDAVVLSLDDFYRDRSHLPLERRARTNFDDPRAIDWECLELTLKRLMQRKPTRVPRYDFATHCRLPQQTVLKSRAIILVDGLWLLRRPSIRRLFDCKVFVQCALQLRFARRLRRDVVERGRTEQSVRKQFFKTVAPMHKKFVQPQARWADVVLPGTFANAEVKALAQRIAQNL